ncbi:hypothetical protein F5Y13DRAFT_205841 [Hypoxylon sp. FL1857]|nr:hypothetical protein F5Y13DRAFT_205841 [Hypoxylon sp. FL1857]
MSNAAHDRTAQATDSESISLYFDLDQAAAPESTETDTPEDSGKSDKSIPGFKPIVSRKDRKNRHKLRLRRTILKQNFSGGFGPYVWPWSTQVMIPQMRRETLREIKLQHKINPNNQKTTKDKKDIDTLPSTVAGIDWKKELREIYRLT